MESTDEHYRRKVCYGTILLPLIRIVKLKMISKAGRGQEGGQCAICFKLEIQKIW